MTSPKTILAIVLAVVLFSGPASAQTSPTESADERVAALEQLAESRETLIEQQQALIGRQEALLNTYRCMFKIDVGVVPGGCPGPALSEAEAAEAADAALLCAGWRGEALSTRQIITDWTNIAIQLENVDRDTLKANGLLRQIATSLLPQYRDRVTVIIPSLQSERLTELMTAVADGIQALADTIAEGSTATGIAAAIRSAVDEFQELEDALAEICA